MSDNRSTNLPPKRINPQLRERRRRQRKKAMMIRRGIVIGVVLIVVLLGVLGVKAIMSKSDEKKLEEQARQEQILREEEQKAATKKEAVAIADRLAAGYDYDAAIQFLKEKQDLEKTSDFKEEISEYEAIKGTLVEADVETIPHVFFHILVADPSITWTLSGADEYKIADYNQVMTTIDEFKKIMQQMYDKDMS